MALAFTSTPTEVVCFFVPATGSNRSSPASAVGRPLTTTTYVNGTTYLDTTTGPYLIGCQQTGGGTMTSSFPAVAPSVVVLTRLDDVTETFAGLPKQPTVVP